MSADKITQDGLIKLFVAARHWRESVRPWKGQLLVPETVGWAMESLIQAVDDLVSGSPVDQIPGSAERDAATEALRMLVQLKDGPRDDLYRAVKDDAWAEARRVLGMEESP
jgi:hypothetical protein